MVQISIEIMSRISGIMESKGISIMKLCKKTGIGESTFWRYKKGKTAPSINLLLLMASAIEVPIDKLISGISSNPILPSTRQKATKASRKELKKQA